jgi:hypothetical protein
MAGLAPRELTDDDRARMTAEAEEQRAAKDAARRRVEARRMGVMVLLEVGVTVWSSSRQDHTAESIGGVVVQISEGERHPNTGFIERRFTCLNPFAGPDRWERTLVEGDINRESVELASTAQLVKLITRLQAAGGRRRANMLTPRDGRMIDYELALKAVVLP